MSSSGVLLFLPRIVCGRGAAGGGGRRRGPGCARDVAPHRAGFACVIRGARCPQISRGQGGGGTGPSASPQHCEGHFTLCASCGAGPAGGSLGGNPRALHACACEQKRRAAAGSTWFRPAHDLTQCGRTATVANNHVPADSTCAAALCGRALAPQGVADCVDDCQLTCTLAIGHDRRTTSAIVPDVAAVPGAHCQGYGLGDRSAIRGAPARSCGCRGLASGTC